MAAPTGDIAVGRGRVRAATGDGAILTRKRAGERTGAKEGRGREGGGRKGKEEHGEGEQGRASGSKGA